MNYNEEIILKRIEEIGLKQFIHLDGLEVRKYNILFRELVKLVSMLRDQNEDRRIILKKHYSHSNLQVRLNAAKNTLAVYPEEARAQLRAIELTNRHPQAMDAGMCLSNLENGIFKPT
jgi:hypothetical protein